LGTLVPVSSSPLYAIVQSPIAPTSATQYSPTLATWPSPRTPYRKSPHARGIALYAYYVLNPSRHAHNIGLGHIPSKFCLLESFSSIGCPCVIIIIVAYVQCCILIFVSNIFLKHFY